MQENFTIAQNDKLAALSIKIRTERNQKNGLSMDFSRFKLLTFDIVGTCIDFEKGVLDAVRRIGGEATANLSDDDIFKPYLDGRLRHYGRNSEVFYDVYKYVAAELGLVNTEAAARDFQLSVLEWPAFADSAQALARLRTRFRLVAMTNGDRTSFTAYDHRLGWPFHDSVTYDDAKCAKPDPRFFSYALSRAGLWWATRTLAQALAPTVRVNGVGPGPTLASVHQSEADFRAEVEGTPLQRANRPEEIADAVLWLSRAPGVTGQMIAVDSGQHLAWRTPDIEED